MAKVKHLKPGVGDKRRDRIPTDLISLSGYSEQLSQFADYL